MNNKLLSFFSAAAIVLVGVLLANSALALEAITYFHNDISGTPLLATDQAGNVVWKEVYRPYGEKLNNLAASSNNSIWFAGKPYDSNTGLSYMGARYYDPVIGRFTGIDPKDFDPNNIHSFNRYAYANNNPYKFVDLDGRDAVLITRTNGSVNILIPIQFSGSGATPAAVTAIKQDVSSRWSGTYTINNSATSVDVSVVDGPSHGKLNSITLTTGPTSYEAAQGASFVRGGNSGEWNVNSVGMKFGEAAHEAGHLMGEGDHYISGTNAAGKRATAPSDGYKGNLMGELPGTTNSVNMQTIMGNNRNLRITE